MDPDLLPPLSTVRQTPGEPTAGPSSGRPSTWQPLPPSCWRSPFRWTVSGCGAEDLVLCVACERRVRLLTGQPFRAEGQAPALMDVDGGVILPVVAAGVYREELAQAVLSFKSHGQHQLQRVLAAALARAISATLHCEGPSCLVPVPTSAGAFVKRGFSPVHLLLRSLGLRRGTGTVQVRDVLAQIPCSRRAGRASREVRKASAGVRGPGGSADPCGWLRGSAKRWPGSRCIIVDDVLTTGATLSEAARALHLAGAVVTGAVVLAATRPPDSAGGGTASAEAGGRRPDLEKNKRRKDE